MAKLQREKVSFDLEFRQSKDKNPPFDCFEGFVVVEKVILHPEIVST